jgi:hypothetical protein
LSSQRHAYTHTTHYPRDRSCRGRGDVHVLLTRKLLWLALLVVLNACGVGVAVVGGNSPAGTGQAALRLAQSVVKLAQESLDPTPSTPPTTLPPVAPPPAVATTSRPTCPSSSGPTPTPSCHYQARRGDSLTSISRQLSKSDPASCPGWRDAIAYINGIQLDGTPHSGEINERQDLLLPSQPFEPGLPGSRGC